MDMIQYDIYPELGEACLMGLFNMAPQGSSGGDVGGRESRQHFRLNVLLEVDLWIGGHLYQSVAHNVSYNGLFVETSCSFSEGLKVFLCMRLNQGGLFCAEGEIIRNSPHGIGVRLIRD